MDISNCEPCNARNKQKTAVKWCTECDEKLCSKCTENHKVMKFARHHSLVDIDKIPQKFDIPSSCSKHAYLQFTHFCIDHDCLYCKDCLRESHRTCVKVVSIDSAAVNAKDSQSFIECSKKISHLLDCLKSLGDIRKVNIINVESDADTIRMTIKNVKQSIMKHLDILEKSLLAEMDQAKDQHVSKMKESVNAIDDIMTETRELQSTFDFINDHGTEKQAFFLVHSLKHSLHTIEDKIQSLSKHAMEVKLSFNDNQLEKLMTAIGSIETTQNPFIVSGFSQKQHSFQGHLAHLATDQKSTITFHHDINLKQKNVIIVGMAVTDNNLLLLCDANSPEIHIYDDSDTYQSSINLQYIPWDIATVQTTTTGVVTSRYNPYVQFLDITRQASLLTIKIRDCTMGGICTTTQNIFVGGKYQIFVLDHQGNILRKIHPNVKQDKTIWYMCVGSNDHIYFTDSNGLYCITLEGNEVFTYASPELLQARKVALDKQGNVYVVGCKSENIHKLSLDGTFVNKISSSEDGLIAPLVFCHSKDCTKVYVANNYGDLISVFKVN